MIDMDTSPPVDEETVVCLGFFDGVHRGHQALLNQAREVAEDRHLTVAVHTFDVLPRAVFRPEEPIQMLTTPECKYALFEALGCEICAVSRFDERMRNMPGEDFFRDVLLGRLHARALVAGEDHRFGRGGGIDIQALGELCRENGIALFVIPKVRLDSGQIVSSTAIREAIARGDEALARQMLGWKRDENGDYCFF